MPRRVIHRQDELVRVAVGELVEAADPDRFEAQEHPRSAERDLEHPVALWLRNGHRRRMRSRLASSRWSDAYCDSNNSSGISGPWNIVKL